MIDLLVIGGGVTGCAVARDAALRGMRVLLAERHALGAGTSGRFHGMLQSGARYATTDPAFAAQCMREREIVERTAPHARVRTGGLFVRMRGEPAEFGERLASGCEAAGIPCTPLGASELAAREPALPPVAGGFGVPDAVLLPWRLVTALAEDADAHGAEIRTGVRVTGIEPDGRTVLVTVRGTDEATERIECAAVAIAAGPWSGELAALAGLRLPLELSKGAMLVIEGRLFGSVVNRCRRPGSFDIMVPFGDVTIFGTTSEEVGDPDATEVPEPERQALVEAAGELAPGVGASGAGTPWAYAGVRPLVLGAPGGDGAVSRRHAVIGDPDGAVVAVAGGSFTSHRAMAEEVVDRVCRRLGSSAACTTASVPLPAPQGVFSWSRAAALQPGLVAASASAGTWGS